MRGRCDARRPPGIRQNIEDRYSAHWPTPPTAGLRDYVAAVRAVFTAFQTGGKLRHVGPHYHLTRLQPFFYPGPLETPPPQKEEPVAMQLTTEVRGKIAAMWT